ncbi:unnamed protein product [marine sediment metagenome]|uniref:Uncharacterized protein n=1 Tax=marine sediment metagenome TaxID=412755 RepID=X1DUV6_9ZZZZ
MAIDIRKGVLYPETHVDARVVRATDGGREVASYSGFKPYIAQLKELATSRNPNTTVRVSVDGAAEVISAATLARYDYDVSEEVDLTALSSLAITLASDVGTGPIAGQIVRHSLRVTKPTVYEKIRAGIRLNEEEKELDEKYGISKKIDSGIMKMLDGTQFLKIKEYATRINALGGVNPVIGRELHATTGMKVVLLGVTSDAPIAPDTVFIRVDRDEYDEIQNYDTFALPTVSEMQKMYIPATDMIRLTLLNTPAVVNHLVRYKYGIAPITILEREKWGLEMSDEQHAISDELMLSEIVKAGVV